MGTATTSHTTDPETYSTPPPESDDDLVDSGILSGSEAARGALGRRGDDDRRDPFAFRF